MQVGGTLPQDGFYGAYTRLRDELGSLGQVAREWDRHFEQATGTYPTHDFVASYRGFTDRVKRAIDFGATLPFANAPELEWLVESSLPSDYRRATGLVLSELERMATNRTPFGRTNTAWSALLDPLVSDLVKGERLATAKLLTMAPDGPSVPNPGPYPGPAPQPPYPGPAPTPYPGPGPYPAPQPAPTPWPAPNPYPGDDLA